MKKLPNKVLLADRPAIGNIKKHVNDSVTAIKRPCVTDGLIIDEIAFETSGRVRDMNP